MTDDLKALAKRCKDVGAKDLTKELNAGIRNSVMPLRKSAPASALRILPKKGGLNVDVASKSKISISKQAYGIKFRMKNEYQLYKIDQGFVRRPVFRRKSRLQKVFRQKRQSLHHTYRDQRVWVVQKVRPGWWTIPTKAASTTANKELESSMDRVAKALEGRG